MKFNLKKSSIYLSVLSVLTFGTVTDAEANFIGRVYTKSQPYEYRASHGKRQIVETRYRQQRYLEITSEFDDPITITNLKVNRGNCHIFFSPKFSFPLKWGQSGEWAIGDCNVREVTIETDRGSQTLRWN